MTARPRYAKPLVDRLAGWKLPREGMTLEEIAQSRQAYRASLTNPADPWPYQRHQMIKRWARILGDIA